MSFTNSKRVQVRRISGALAALFLASGLTKLLSVDFQADLFQRFGLPVWSLGAMGALEVIFALLILNRSTRSLGSVGLTLLLIGASMAHVMTGVALPMLFVNAALGVASVWVLLRRRPAFLQVSRSA